MATYQSFTHSPTEYAASLTNHTHMTLDWLVNHDFITSEAWEELTSTLIVTGVQNNKSWGRKIVERFFNKDSTEDTWVFPIVKLDSCAALENSKPTKPTKPKLEIV